MCGIRTVSVSLSGLSVIMNWTPRKRLFMLDWCVFHCANAHILYCTQLVHKICLSVLAIVIEDIHVHTHVHLTVPKISIKG